MTIDILAEKDKFLAVMRKKYPKSFEIPELNDFDCKKKEFKVNSVQAEFNGWLSAKENLNAPIDPEHTELHTLYCDILKENERLKDVILKEAKVYYRDYNRFLFDDNDRSLGCLNRSEILLEHIGLKLNAIEGYTIPKNANPITQLHNHESFFSKENYEQTKLLDEITEISQLNGLYDVKENKDHE